jgi:DNA polymerase III sliding clamp (beta) subunit (PCNA family)
LKTINIEIPLADLKPVLPGFSKIIGKRTSLPVLGMLKITLNPDKSLHIQATNFDQFVTARFNKPFRGSCGSMLVPLDELSSIAKLCSITDTLELRSDTKETVISYPAAGTIVKKPVQYLKLDEFPPEMTVDAEPVQLDDAFKEALDQALDCASTDSSRYTLNGACLDVTSDKKAHYVVATDGRHLFSANSFVFNVPESIILPHGKFLTWSGFLEDGPWTLRYQPAVGGTGKAKTGARPATVRLDSEHWTFVTRPIEGEYPNWKQVVPSSPRPTRIVLGEAGVEKVLEALPLLPDADHVNQPVSLDTVDGDLILKARNPNDEWTKIPIAAELSGPPVDVSVNRTFLAKALRFGMAEIGLTDALSPLVFKAKGKTMVVMPVTPDAGEPASAPGKPAGPTQTESAEKTPSAAEEQKTEERTETMRTTTMTAPQRGNLTGHTNGSTKPAEQPLPLIDRIEEIKETVKTLVRDLNTLVDAVKQAEKDQRASEREVESARATLKKLQQVTI